MVKRLEELGRWKTASRGLAETRVARNDWSPEASRQSESVLGAAGMGGGAGASHEEGPEAAGSHGEGWEVSEVRRWRMGSGVPGRGRRISRSDGPVEETRRTMVPGGVPFSGVAVERVNWRVRRSASCSVHVTPSLEDQMVGGTGLAGGAAICEGRAAVRAARAGSEKSPEMNCWKAGGSAREGPMKQARRKTLSSDGGGMSDGGVWRMPEVAVGSKGKGR